MQTFIDFMVWIWKKKVTIIITEILAFFIAFFIAFFVIKPQYSSSVTFFLPNNTSSNSALGLLSGLSGIELNTGSNIDPSQIEILFNTLNYKKDFIEYMGLIERYKLQKSINPLVLAIKALNKNLAFETIEKGSIASTEPISYKVTYFDDNPDSAFMGVNYLYTSLNSMIREISVSRALEEQRYFLGNINETSLKLDSLKMDFIIFQEENKLFAMNTQRDITIGVYSQLLSNKIQLNISYNEFVAKYGRNNNSAIEIKNKIDVIDDVIKTLPLDTSSLLLRSLSDMNYYKYLEYVRDIEFYTSVSLFLRNEYEQILLRINNEMKSLQLVDKAIRPDYKSRPKRVFIVAVAMFLYNFVLFSVLGSTYGYNLIKKKGYLDAFFKAL